MLKSSRSSDESETHAERPVQVPPPVAVQREGRLHPLAVRRNEFRRPRVDEQDVELGDARRRLRAIPVAIEPDATEGRRLERDEVDRDPVERLDVLGAEAAPCVSQEAAQAPPESAQPSNNPSRRDERRT